MLWLIIGRIIFTGAHSLLKVTNQCSSTNTGTLDILVGVTLFFLHFAPVNMKPPMGESLYHLIILHELVADLVQLSANRM